MLLGHPLFSPDADGTQAGGAPALTPASAPPAAGATVTPDQPAAAAPEPSGTFVPTKEYERLTREAGKAAGQADVYRQVQERGFDSFEATLPALDRLRALESDPRANSVVEALLTRPEQATQEQSTQEPLTDQRVLELMDQRLTQREQADFQQRYQRDSQTETALLSQATTQNEQFKAILGETSYEDAVDGKGSVTANAFAQLLDNQLFNLAQKVNGTPMPVTDPAVMQQAVSNTLSTLGAIKAMTLMEASQHPGSGEQSSETVPREETNNALTDEEAMHRAAKAVGQASFDRMTKGGLPASTSI